MESVKYNLSMEFKLLEYTDIFELVKQIADYCIINQIKRTDDYDAGWFYFEKKEIKEINRADKTKGKKMKCDGGYCFMDNDSKDCEGMVRLYYGNANPKFSFWVKDNEVKVDFC